MEPTREHKTAQADILEVHKKFHEWLGDLEDCIELPEDGGWRDGVARRPKGHIREEHIVYLEAKDRSEKNEESNFTKFRQLIGYMSRVAGTVSGVVLDKRKEELLDHDSYFITRWESPDGEWFEYLEFHMLPGDKATKVVRKNVGMQKMKNPQDRNIQWGPVFGISTNFWRLVARRRKKDGLLVLVKDLKEQYAHRTDEEED